MKKIVKAIVVLVFFVLIGTNAYADETEIYGVDPIHDPWGYILPESNQRYLTESDIKGLSLKEVSYAKNEIYARRGRKFLSTELQNYFNGKDWYKASYEPEDFDANYGSAIMNTYEKVNADFLATVEYSIDPNGYQLDSGMGEWQEESAPVSYDDILGEYKRAINDNFSNMNEYQYIPPRFNPSLPFNRGEKVYYTLYDFLDDGLAELVISVYYEASEYEDACYSIVDIYGTDGETVQKLEGENMSSAISYRLCENDVIEAHESSGGLSVGGLAYYQLHPNAATAEKIEEIRYYGTGECYKVDLEDPNNLESIESFEYKKIVESYPDMEDIPFEWKEIVADM